MFFYLFVSVFIETINEKQISLGRGYKTFLFKYQWPKVLSWLFLSWGNLSVRVWLVESCFMMNSHPDPLSRYVF